MRRMILAALLAGSAHAAQAADMPDFSNMPLRGALNTGPVNWQGYYAGGQAGYGSSDFNFSGSNSGLIRRALGPDNVLQDTIAPWSDVSGKVSVRQTTYGGFGGYNGQWDDVVLGIEANYMHGRFVGAAGQTVAPGTYGQSVRRSSVSYSRAGFFSVCFRHRHGHRSRSRRLRGRQFPSVHIWRCLARACRYLQQCNHH